MMPQLYIPGPRGTAFGWRVLGMWLMAALWSSVVCFYLPALALTPAAVSSTGLMIDIWATGTLAYTLIVITVRPSTMRSHSPTPNPNILCNPVFTLTPQPVKPNIPESPAAAVIKPYCQPLIVSYSSG